VVITLKVPIEMHYTVIPMGTSKVNSSRKVLYSRIEIDLDPNIICNKLLCGDYDYWWPVLTQKGSSASIMSGKNTRRAENPLHIWKIAATLGKCS